MLTKKYINDLVQKIYPNETFDKNIKTLLQQHEQDAVINNSIELSNDDMEMLNKMDKEPLTKEMLKLINEVNKKNEINEENNIQHPCCKCKYYHRNKNKPLIILGYNPFLAPQPDSIICTALPEGTMIEDRIDTCTLFRNKVEENNEK